MHPKQECVWRPAYKPRWVGVMALELCLAWVCVHPLVVAQQAEEGGGNVCLVANGAGCLLGSEPGGEPWTQRDVLSQGKGSCVGWPVL